MRLTVPAAAFPEPQQHRVLKQIEDLMPITGEGSPEGVVVAGPGRLYVRTDGAVNLYVKTSGTGNTGWVAQ